MSAMPPIATKSLHRGNRRVGPLPGSCTAAKTHVNLMAATVRTEAALPAAASGRKLVSCPVAGGLLWIRQAAGHTPTRPVPCIADS
jgi:hypothetical protein